MDDTPKSHFQQTVCLGDWWLVKAENDDGRQLAVSGFSSRENQAMRVFSSAPILKRHDFSTLETSDGICVILKGFINKARTMESGFPSDVYNHFLLGFPPYWKEYDEKFMGKQPLSNISGVNILEKLLLQSESGTNSCNFEVSGLHGPENEIKLSELDADSVKDEYIQISEAPNQGKDKVKMQGNMQKTKNKSTRSLSTPDAAGNRKDNVIAGNNSSSEKAKASGMRTRRSVAFVSTPGASDNRKGNVIAGKNSSTEKAKTSGMRTRRNLAFETPNAEKKKLPNASPQSLSFNRSRSGRLLMPTLEFWRNQRAIYSAEVHFVERAIKSEIFQDRTITGIVEGLDPKQLRKGSKSTSRKKREATNLKGS